MLRPNVNDPADPGAQNRFSALRSFEVLACDGRRQGLRRPRAPTRGIYTSPADAFQTRAPASRAAPT